MTNNDDAYILHVRPYRESSQLVTFLSHNFGRFTAVSRGTRKAKGGNPLRPFVALEISWRGKTDLKNLISVETSGPSFRLQGEALYVGLYLNELLVRILHEHVPSGNITAYYQQTLVYLEQTKVFEPILRMFELHLLEELGYGLQLDTDTSSGERIEAEGRYLFSPQEGLRRYSGKEQNKHVFTGAHLIAISQGRFDDPPVLRSAKKITRQALAPYLGEKPLMSRELFRGFIGNQKVSD